MHKTCMRTAAKLRRTHRQTECTSNMSSDRYVTTIHTCRQVGVLSAAANTTVAPCRWPSVARYTPYTSVHLNADMFNTRTVCMEWKQLSVQVMNYTGYPYCIEC